MASEAITTRNAKEPEWFGKCGWPNAGKLGLTDRMTDRLLFLHDTTTLPATCQFVLVGKRVTTKTKEEKEREDPTNVKFLYTSREGCLGRQHISTGTR